MFFVFFSHPFPQLRAYDLKAILNFRGLSAIGSRKALIQRILDNQDGVEGLPSQYGKRFTGRRGPNIRTKNRQPPSSSSSSSSTISDSDSLPEDISADLLSRTPKIPMDAVNEHCVLFSASSSSTLKLVESLPPEREWKEGPKGKGVFYARYGELPKAPKLVSTSFLPSLSSLLTPFLQVHHWLRYGFHPHRSKIREKICGESSRLEVHV